MVVWLRVVAGEVMSSGQVWRYFEGRVNRLCEDLVCDVRRVKVKDGLVKCWPE